MNVGTQVHPRISCTRQHTCSRVRSRPAGTAWRSLISGSTGNPGRRRLPANDILPVPSLAFLLFLSLLTAGAQSAQHTRPGRGAISAQDLAKLAAPGPSPLAAPSTSDPADQVCPRFAAGSATTAPPELESQNGVLEVTLKFLTVTDSQGLLRYCYITDTGLQAPTLRVNPGDQLIIHFQNDLPATLPSSRNDNMAGMKMSLASGDAATEHQQRLQWNHVVDRDQYPLPWNQCGARLRTG